MDLLERKETGGGVREIINHITGPKIIIDLCGGTGSWSKPYKDAGYKVMVITLPDWDVTDVEFLLDRIIFRCQTKYAPYDCLSILYKDIYGILAAPPCTEFSLLNCIAEQRDRNLDEGMKAVNACLAIIKKCEPKFHAIENPIGYLKNYLGKPDFTFQPWEFGDAWTKRTCIWGNFNHPQKLYSDWEDVPKLDLYTRPNRGKPNYAYLHKSAVNSIPQLSGYHPKTDAEFRAITPPGFAQSFFKANQ